jgi:hypothetical protein
MSKLANLIRIFDIYGNYFQLRINNQSKFTTISGGFITLLTFIILALYILSLSNDFLKRKNPNISVEEGLFQDSELPVLNGTEYPIKPVLLTVAKTFSKYSKLRITTTDSFSYIEECDPSYIIKYFPEYNLTLYSNTISNYCFNLNDYILSNAGDLIITADECSKIDETVLSDMLSKNITCITNIPFAQPSAVLNIYTKQIGFKPELENPFYNKTKKYALSFLNIYATYVNVFWDLQYLNEDIGWLTEDINEKADITPEQEISIQKPADGKKLPNFFVRFQLNDKFRKYYRTYPKLQDVLAALGGFSKLLFTFLNLLSTLVRSYLVDLYIIDEKFENAQKQKPKADITRNPNINSGEYVIKNLNCSLQSKFS